MLDGAERDPACDSGEHEDLHLLEPVSTPTNAHRSKTRHVATTPKKLKHSKKKTLKIQVRELQATVNQLQAQVNEAAAKIHLIMQLVGKYVEQQKEREKLRRREDDQHQSFGDQELEMSVEEQQRHLQKQIKREYEQHLLHCEFITCNDCWSNSAWRTSGFCSNRAQSRNNPRNQVFSVLITILFL
ncbi:unnamed protein product [Phytophthora lilii]|uniref:Unnamed protein product n=1 Tax=Phytophthora lilii TaxID=2077276 RepID=A0A9W6WWI2_9STRA|nr:unnamed protein product [Phytophthora lilii]